MRPTHAALHPQSRALLADLEPQPPDPLLALIAAYRDDPRSTKLDLGVGVYRDAAGCTPVLRAVKSAEQLLHEHQASKGYLGPEGDLAFVERLQPILLGDLQLGSRLVGLQTPGGTGALRLAAELIAVARPGGRLIMGTPTWPNHSPIFKAVQLELVSYRYFDTANQRLCFDEMMTALGRAEGGDVVLLHGCCHNPTGADLSLDQWAGVADIIQARGLVPLIDLAYQGLGRNLEADAAGARLVLEAAEEALVAYSCDKNFGLYRERTGALYALSRNSSEAAVAFSNLLSLARANWSMPPDHGAAIVRSILELPSLTAAWRAELSEMQSRIADIRRCLAAMSDTLGPLASQFGMFSTLPLTPVQIDALRTQHGIFMAGSGRVNLAGLTVESAPRFVEALADVCKPAGVRRG